jgi:mono/diheme cytochrome c family protein
MSFVLLWIVAAALQNPQPAQTPAGNVERGRTLYTVTYKCYACHGYQGETGTPRLVPMARTQDEFITYLRKPTAAAMPAYPDATAQQLADIYA